MVARGPIGKHVCSVEVAPQGSASLQPVAKKTQEDLRGQERHQVEVEELHRESRDLHRPGIEETEPTGDPIERVPKSLRRQG